MTLKIEILLGLLTITSTMITGDFFTDLVVGIAVYTISRLFYKQLGYKLNGVINRFKSILEKWKERIKNNNK